MVIIYCSNHEQMQSCQTIMTIHSFTHICFNLFLHMMMCCPFESILSRCADAWVLLLWWCSCSTTSFKLLSSQSTPASKAATIAQKCQWFCFKQILYSNLMIFSIKYNGIFARRAVWSIWGYYWSCKKSTTNFKACKRSSHFL